MKRSALIALSALLTLTLASPQSGTAQTKPVIRLAYVCGGMNAMVAQLPINNGAYERAGLDVQKVCFPGGAPAVQALIGKSVDVFAGSSEHILRAQSKGIPLKAYACLQNSVGYTLITKGDSKYKTIADLKGETIGITAPKSLSDTGLRRGLEIAKIDPEREVSIVAAGSGATMVAALDTSRIAAGMVSQPEVARLVVEKKYRVLYDPTFEYAGIVLMARADWVADNKPAMQTLIRTVAQAAAAAKRDPQTAAADMIKEFPNIDKAIMLTAVTYQNGLVPAGFVVPRRGLQDVNDIEVRDKNIPAAIPYEQAVDANLLTGVK